MLIGELAQRTGLSKDGIRHYEKLGILHATLQKAGSRWYRDYDEHSVERIKQVNQAQRLGLTLKEIAPLLETYNTREVTTAETIAFLEGRLRVIQDKIKALQQVEDFIHTKLRAYQEQMPQLDDSSERPANRPQST